MNQAQLIAAMLEAAYPVIEAYQGDLRHDARLLADALPGSTFLWAPRKHGTFVILLQREGRPNVRAASTFSAMQAQGEAVAWRYASIGPGVCSLSELNAEAACMAAWEATRRAENNPANQVSELHL